MGVDGSGSPPPGPFRMGLGTEHLSFYEADSAPRAGAPGPPIPVSAASPRTCGKDCEGSVFPQFSALGSLRRAAKETQMGRWIICPTWAAG